MKLKIGEKVRVTYKRGHGNHVVKIQKIGEILYINTKFIVVKFEKYKESFNITDMVTQGDKFLEVRRHKQWIKIEKEMF